jgi:hypothetical protein
VSDSLRGLYDFPKDGRSFVLQETKIRAGAMLPAKTHSV